MIRALSGLALCAVLAVCAHAGPAPGAPLVFLLGPPR